MNKEYLCTCLKTRARLNEEAIKAMDMTDEQFEDYRASEERDFKLNKWKYISLYERAIGAV